nr:histone-lysine N-methyltransferase SETMAR [Haemonchus contortus]
MHRATLVPQFRAGNTSLEDEPHGSRLPTLDNDHLKASVEADPHKTTRDIAKELSVHHTTNVRHLKQIGKIKKLGKWVPHESTESQKNRRFEISSAHLLRNASDPFLERIVTCGEK